MLHLLVPVTVSLSPVLFSLRFVSVSNEGQAATQAFRAPSKAICKGIDPSFPYFPAPDESVPYIMHRTGEYRLFVLFVLLLFIIIYRYMNLYYEYEYKFVFGLCNTFGDSH